LATVEYELQLAEVSKPIPWPLGPKSDPAGKLPGTRTAFSQGFVAITRWSGLKRA
jgi:hypothetical protein